MSPIQLLRVASVEARKLMSYRVDFWINALAGFAVEMTVAYFLWSAIFAESGAAEIGGFSRQGMILYYLLVLLIGKLVRGNERQAAIASDIYEGSLTRYLLYPGGYFGFKYAEHLGGLLPALVQLALLGTAGGLLLDFSQVGGIGWRSVAAALLAVALANLLNFLLAWNLQAIAFWADNVWTLNVMVRFIGNILGGLMLPLSLFPDWARELLALLPFQYLFYFPVMTLLGRVDGAAYATGLLAALIWCGLLAASGRLIWRRGYLTYTGVGI